jgi:hypothetical protein
VPTFTDTPKKIVTQAQQDKEKHDAHSKEEGTNILSKRTEQAKHGLIHDDDGDDEIHLNGNLDAPAAEPPGKCILGKYPLAAMHWMTP